MRVKVKEDGLIYFVIPALLLLNLLYLIVAASCLFAILKRGYFILSSGQDGEKIVVDWEKFARTGSGQEAKQFNTFSWNIDNYYTGVICVLIIALSICLCAYGLCKFTGWGKAIPIVLFALHLVPAWALTKTWTLSKMCHQLAQPKN